MHAVFIPELAVDLEKEGARLKVRWVDLGWDLWL